MNYQTQIKLLGLPLVHISTMARRPGAGWTKGWIAVGDRVFGVLFALGGVAIGGIAIGGLSLGILSLGGLAAGIIGFGGLAIGVWAVGGLAIALFAAQGGFAMAAYFAEGGGAVAKHANDAVSAYFFEKSFLTPLTSFGTWSMRYVLQPVLLLALVAWVIMARRRSRA